MKIARSMWKNFKKALGDRYDNDVTYTRNQMIKRDLAVLWLVFTLGAILCLIGYIVISSTTVRLFATIMGVALMTLWSLSTLIDD